MTGILRSDVPAVDSSGRLSREWYRALIGIQQSVDGLTNATLYTDTGTVNQMQIDSGITAYKRGLIRYVKPAFTNTSSTVTLSDSGLSPQAVILGDGTLPAIGQLIAGATLQVQYNGAAWEIQNLSNADITVPANATIGGNATVGGTLQVTGLTSLKTVDSTVVDDAANALPIGFKGKPQIIKNSNATTVLSDRGKHWYHSDGNAYTWTIDSNANVPYPIGTEITFVSNATAGVNITLAITADTLVFISAGTTGSRTLGRYARATALKVAATIWVIDGVGIT